MSRIKELLKDNNSILVFDVDGVLALMEFGDRNHYYASDEDWDNEVDNGLNLYTEDKVSKKMQQFLLKKLKVMNKFHVYEQFRNDLDKNKIPEEFLFFIKNFLKKVKYE